MSNRSYPPAPGPRDVVLKVPVTAQERAELSRIAAKAGRSIAEIVRVNLFTADGDNAPVVTLGERGD